MCWISCKTLYFGGKGKERAKDENPLKWQKFSNLYTFFTRCIVFPSSWHNFCVQICRVLCYFIISHPLFVFFNHIFCLFFTLYSLINLSFYHCFAVSFQNFSVSWSSLCIFNRILLCLSSPCGFYLDLIFSIIFPDFLYFYVNIFYLLLFA